MTTLLDLTGVVCIAALAFFIWPPATLGVVGVAAILVSRQLSQAPRPPRKPWRERRTRQ